jgi:hypothetical protein
MTILTMLAAARHDIVRMLAARPFPAVPAGRAPRPVRLYAVSEDGTLISTPWDEGGEAADTIDRESSRLGARPGLPAFAPMEFFFRFGPGDLRAQAAYSGFYLDVGGRGLVSTLTIPVLVREGERGVMGLDLAFDVDWRSFAAVVDPPVVAPPSRSPTPGAHRGPPSTPRSPRTRRGAADGR